VGITSGRLRLICEYLGGMPPGERKRLARQKRDQLDCGFLDKETHRCAIYPVRPWVCAIFGRAEGLVCPKVGHLVQIMPAFLVDQGFEREGIVGHAAVDGMIECHANEQPAGMSSLWDWRTMDFE
jgi:hypothetical protein